MKERFSRGVIQPGTKLSLPPGPRPTACCRDMIATVEETEMSDPAVAVAVVRRFYDSKGDPAVTAEVMAADIVGDITPGFPGGGVYRGLDSVVNIHLWTVRDGKLARLQQAADSLVIDRALNG
jgi:hypothetical protein